MDRRVEDDPVTDPGSVATQRVGIHPGRGQRGELVPQRFGRRRWQGRHERPPGGLDSIPLSYRCSCCTRPATRVIGHAPTILVPVLGATPGRATGQDEHWELVARLLHDDGLELTDRVAGALLLLYGEPLSRITAITTEQVSTREEQTLLRPGREDIDVPDPLAGLLLALSSQPHRYLGVGSPQTSKWLFPACSPAGH